MRAVFFDRDGTLMEEVQYCADPAKVRVYAGVPEALRELKRAGFAVLVVSNQSGVGRGWISAEQHREVHAEFLRQVGAGLVDASYYCPDAPGVPSECRKPEPGMVLRAAAEHGIELENSFVVGDKASDIECGRRAGAKTVLVLTGYGAEQRCQADWVCADAAAAVKLMLTLQGG